MKDIVVFAKNTQTYFAQRLKHELGERVIFFNPWMDAHLPEARKYLVRTTGVYQSDLDLMLLSTLKPDKIINPLPALRLFRSKPSQFNWFEEQDIPCLPWISLKGQDLLVVEKFFRLYPQAVVKPSVGQGGWGVELLSWEKFRSWKKKKGADQDYLLQPYIQGARELRYFFIKDQFSCLLERSPQRELAANFKNHGQAKLSTAPESIIQKLKGLVESSGALYGAIDFFLQADELLVLELNVCPGIEQLEMVSGENIISQLSAKYFCQDD
jgi:glutathione synthase/RimK-type ligase-like ATP-grasp enzyme